MESKLLATLYSFYDAVLIFIPAYHIIYTITSMAQITDFQEICLLVSIAAAMLPGVLIPLFFLHYQKKIERFKKTLNDLNQKILNSTLGVGEKFKTMYLKTAQRNISYSRKILFLVFCSPMVYTFPVPITDFINGSYRDSLPQPIVYNYDVHLPGVYEITFLLNLIGLTVSCMKKVGNDCFFMSLFNIQKVYLSCLSSSIDNYKEKFTRKNDVFIKKTQILWVDLHSDIIRSINELVSIYAPIIIIYYFNLIMIIVSCFFTQLKNENDSFIQGFGVGGFGLISVYQLYLISSSAEALATESEGVAFAIYDTHWYDMSKSNSEMVRLMLAMARNPVKVTAYKAETFLLNKETFIGFVASCLTAFMTFAQIDDMHSQYQDEQ